MFETLKLKINNFYQDIADIFNNYNKVPYDLSGYKQFLEIKNKGVRFGVKPRKDAITLTSKELPGLYISIPNGLSPVEIMEIVNDSIMVYCDVPRRLIKKEIKTLNTQFTDPKTGKVIVSPTESTDKSLLYK